MPIRNYLAAAIAAFFIFTTQITPSQAAQCDKLPPVEWWTKSHARVIASVNKKYDGNWKKYIARWVSYRDRMQNLYDTNSTAVVKSRNLKLRGKHLAGHIKDVNARINVLHCLSKNNGSDSGNDSNDFKTKASAKAPKTQPSKSEVQVAEVSATQLDVEVSVRCEKTTAIFLITNLGNKWPSLGEIKIYDVKNQSMLSHRRIRLRNSQQATFRVQKRGGGFYDTVGLWISPTWEKRPFKYDAKISCSS
ncbi:MAG: hypothetical protein HOF23_13150 [Rhodospirillaceae bacterium]|nr:hypothetical protein [Rhodospirillaceae bacterium]MBT5941784.1 hypothetical protein [Rhodospirillaceae bacterium]